MAHMGRTTSVRDLHLKTSGIVKQVEAGGVVIIEKRRLPNRETFIRRLPQVKTDSGRILERDRT
jgi:hypothetical protein